MKPFHHLAALTALCVPIACVAGCDDDDAPAEEATEQRMEDSAESFGENLQDAGEDLVDTVGAAGERTGQALKDSGDDVGRALEGAGEKMQEADDDDLPPATRPSDPG